MYHLPNTFMIRYLRTIGVILIACTIMHAPAFAGGPEIRFKEAHIDDVIFDHRGLVLIISGIAKLKGVSLPMKKAELRYLGDRLSAVSLAGRKAYLARIKAMKGTTQDFQLWGTSVVIEGGHLVRVVAQSASHLKPKKGERRFDIDRLFELEAQ